MDYTRYLCISERHTNDHSGNQSTDKGANQVVFKLKDGYKSKAMLDDKCFLVLNCTCLFERYENCNYINPDWVDAPQKKRGTEAGTWHENIPRPSFRIHIGDKGWSSSQNDWVPAGSGADLCSPQMKWDEKNYSLKSISLDEGQELELEYKKDSAEIYNEEQLSGCSFCLQQLDNVLITSVVTVVSIIKLRFANAKSNLLFAKNSNVFLYIVFMGRSAW